MALSDGRPVIQEVHLMGVDWEEILDADGEDLADAYEDQVADAMDEKETS